MNLAFCPGIRSLFYFDGVIGAKVLDPQAFKAIVTTHVPRHLEQVEQDEDGGWLIEIPSEVLPLLSSGLGRRHKDPESYVVRSHHGRVVCYLKREFASAPERCQVNVLTKDAYIRDWREHAGNSLTDAEIEHVTHVVCSVKVTTGPETPPAMKKPHEFIAKLAHAAGDASKMNRIKVTHLCNEAFNINNYWRNFIEVAD